MRHLPSWSGLDLQLSPNFPNDRTAYLTLDPVHGAGGLGRKRDSLYRSYDAGDTWIASGELTAVAPDPDPSRSRNVYAFGYGRGSWDEPTHTESTRAYASTDAGATWRALGELPDPNTVVRHLDAIARPESDTPVLIAIAGGREEYSAGAAYIDPRVYRSTDGGWTWSVVLKKYGYLQNESLLVARSTVAGTALILDPWDETLFGNLSATVTPSAPGQRPLPKTLRSYDLGATWHYVRLREHDQPLATTGDGVLIGANVDMPAVGIYTLATATPRPSATRTR